MTLRTRIVGTGAVSTQNVQVSWAEVSTGAPGGSIGIGRFGASNGFYSNANIGIFRIYNRALTPIEVQQNFNATRARFNI